MNVTRVIRTENDSFIAEGTGGGGGSGDGLVTTDIPATDQEVQDSLHCTNSSRNDGELLSDWITRTCVWCHRLHGTNDSSEYSNNTDNLLNHTVVEQRAKLEFLVRSPGLWLHAYQYKVNDKSFRTEIPDWCHI